MTITFYNTNDMDNVMNKSLEYINGFNNLPLKKDMDILNPIFEMTFNTDYVQKINYMYIDDFKRYYFAKCELMTGGRVKIQGNVDVLMSWREKILQHSAWIERQIEGNSYIADNMLNEIHIPKPFARKIQGIEFSNLHYILIANGRGE